MNVRDFIQYFPDTLNEEICDNIIFDLKKKLPETDLLPRFLDKISEEDKEYKCLSEAVKEIKQKYLQVIPDYVKNYHDVSGEDFNIKEAIHKKLRVHYYPTGGNVGIHIDNTGARKRYMKKNKSLPNTERNFAQLSCLVFLNDNYEGGEFVVADQEYETSKGSALIFPANFMFPHKVKEVTKGERWSIGAFLR